MIATKESMGNDNAIYFGPDTIESRAIAEARHNAYLLLEDARLLYRHERWSTSISLSILACEEAGKIVMLNHNLGTPFESFAPLRRHDAKQKEFSDYLRSCLRVSALLAYTAETGEGSFEEHAIHGLSILDGFCQISMKNGGSDDASLYLHAAEIVLKAIAWNYFENDRDKD
jgi:AbiV family abortive infection protein